MANRDIILRAELKEIEKAFINDQLKRDQELLKILEVREKEMEASLNYREKLWTERLDMCNSNMIKMCNAQGEFEGVLNSIGGRQNELIRTNAKMLEWITNQLLGDKTAENP